MSRGPVPHQVIRRRISYPFKKKKEVIECALRTCPTFAAAQHGVNVKTVRTWIYAQRQIAAKARTIPERKRRLRQNCEFIRTNVEVPLVQFVKTATTRQRVVFSFEIRNEAIRIFNATRNPRRVQFKASDGWARNFMRRYFPVYQHALLPRNLVGVPGANPAGNLINQAYPLVIHPNYRPAPVPVARPPPNQLLGCSVM